MKPIYLDTNATTPVDPAVVDAMLPFLRENFGNPYLSIKPICGMGYWPLVAIEK